MAERKKRNKPNDRNYDNRNRNNNHNDKRSHNNNRNSSSKKQSNQELIANDGQTKPQGQFKPKPNNDLLIFIVFLVGLAGFFLARKFYFPQKKIGIYGAVTNIKFMKEGKLTFRDAQSDEMIIGIEIEVAKSNYEIEKGLMHRKSLPVNAGMLFDFGDESYRTFWMKNTYLGLDIIFLNKEKEIIRICKNATPLSEVSIPSGGKAQYVVEVLAGFTDAYQIHLGDRIDFKY